MSAYVIFNYEIIDRSKIDVLTEKSLPVNEKYGAEVIVGSPVKTIEGVTLPNIVILKFKNFQSAKDWYYSEEHKEIILLRNAITKGWATIVPDINETDNLIQTGYFKDKV